MSPVETTINTVISLDDLDFHVFKDNVLVAKVDWFDPLKAEIFKYPKGHKEPLHVISGKILLTVLRGRVQFQERDGPEEIAEAGMFRKCSDTIPWRTEILEDSYILAVQTEGSEMVYVNE